MNGAARTTRLTQILRDSTCANTSLEAWLGQHISIHSLKSRVNRNLEEKVIVAVCGLPELYIYII